MTRKLRVKREPGLVRQSTVASIAAVAAVIVAAPVAVGTSYLVRQPSVKIGPLQNHVELLTKKVGRSSAARCHRCG